MKNRDYIKTYESFVKNLYDKVKKSLNKKAIDSIDSKISSEQFNTLLNDDVLSIDNMEFLLIKKGSNKGYIFVSSGTLRYRINISDTIEIQPKDKKDLFYEINLEITNILKYRNNILKSDFLEKINDIIDESFETAIKDEFTEPVIIFKNCPYYRSDDIGILGAIDHNKHAVAISVNKDEAVDVTNIKSNNITKKYIDLMKELLEYRIVDSSDLTYSVVLDRHHKHRIIIYEK